MSAAAKARGATGFLVPGDLHTVEVESIGVVYKGRNKRDAERSLRAWQKLSQQPIGRAAGKAVNHSIEKAK